MASVKKPGVSSSAPAITRHRPSNTSTTGRVPSASCRCARISTPMPCRRSIQAPITAVSTIERQRRPEPDPAADLDEQRDLEERHADEGGQQNQAEPWTGRGLFLRAHDYMIV